MSGAASEPTGPNCQRQRDYVVGEIRCQKKKKKKEFPLSPTNDYG